MMYLTVKQQLKHLARYEYKVLKELCRYSKNLRNQMLYEVRQEYFRNKKHLGYNQAYHILKNSDNYKLLQSNMAQQILKSVDEDFKSFFGLLKSSKAKKVHMPRYLPKDGYADLRIQQINISKNTLQIPYSRTFAKTHAKIYIRIPTVLIGKRIKEIKIKPKYNARFFEITYAYEAEDVTPKELDDQKALAIDLGINNFCTCADSDGRSFIIDGKRIKSVNQWFNKEQARLQGIKDKQKYGKNLTKRQANMCRKRANQIRDFLGKAAKKIIDYCLGKSIGCLVLGKNDGFQDEPDLGKAMNQKFTQIPYGLLKRSLKYRCEQHGIKFVEQEESYTSMASFLDKDSIPVFAKDVHYSRDKFSGRRIHRGLYRTSNGTLINADVNGALNILRKSNVVSLETLYSRGGLGTPIRIRVA